jgi:hypothetical protein
MKPALCFLLAAACLPLLAQSKVELIRHEDSIAVQIDGKPFTTFFMSDAQAQKPYLHPLRAASGTTVSRMFPMEKADGDPVDHPHQRGLWFAHANVNELDFWNNEATYKTPNRGKIVLEKVDRVETNKLGGVIQATFAWTDLTGHKLLTESRKMTFPYDEKNRIVDFDITVTAVDKVTFFDEKDGIFGIRMRPDLQESGHSGKIVNAEGLETEKQVWSKPSNWCDYAGDVKGEKLGIAILDHPGNPHHPARWHARGYGLFAANSIAIGAFTRDKSQNGSLVLEPGQSLRFRYRVIIHPGDAKTADIAAAWLAYSATK